MKPRKLTLLASAVVIAIILTAVFKCYRDRDVTPTPPEANSPSVKFIVPEKGVEVARDYNQRLFIPIRNDGPGIARLRISSSHFPDFPCGFVGRGTPDWEEPDTVLEIPVGEIWEAPLLVHGNVAQSDEYTLTLTATHEGKAAGEESLVVRLAKPELKLETTWLLPATPLDKARLLRTLRIRNTGVNIPNLSLRFEPSGDAPARPVHLDPVLEQTTLGAGEITEVAISPYLYPSFEKLEGTIILSGFDQEHPIPYTAKVPEGKSVFVTLSRTSSRTSNSGTRCTNMPGSSYSMPPTSGTPASTDWGGGGSGNDGGGGGMGGGLRVGDSNPAPEPETSGQPEDEKDEEESSWTLFGPIDGITAESDDDDDDDDDEAEAEAEADDTESTEDGGNPDDQEDDEEDNPDMGTFDLLDANTEDVVNGFIPPAAFGKSIPATLDISEIMKTDDAPDPSPGLVPEGAITTFGPKKDKKESSSHADKDGKRTHLTRRTRDDGAQFLNFGWGISGKGRKLNGYFGPTPTSRPVLGPNPRPDAPALATYVKKGGEDNLVVETLDPETGKAVTLSDPAKNADSPVSLNTPNGVETLFREDGEVRRVALDETLKPTPSETWPAGEKTGPILGAENLADGKLALLTKDAPNSINLRTEAGARSFEATDASIASNGDRLMLAGRKEDGSIFAMDPENPSSSFSPPGQGFGSPALVKTKDGGLRMFYNKPLPGNPPKSGEGAELGGNFAVDFENGQWGVPKRVYMPDAPVTDAAVAVEFTPPFDRAHYKEMDTGISLNGRKLQTLEKQIPFGRYLYQVPTSELGYRADASVDSDAENQVVIDSKGIGPGNFLISDKASVYGLHDMTQGCYVATSNAEADRLAQLSSPQLRHDVHDIVLATNGAQLPRDLAPGEKREFTFSAFNAGDKPSPEMRVAILYETVDIGGGQLASLPPFRGAPITVSFTVPVSWQPGTSLRLVAQALEFGDADPSTNRLNLDLLREFQPAIAGPTAPSGVDVGTLPRDRVTSVDPATSENPATYELSTGREWFRCAIPPAGDLQVSVTGKGAGLVDRIDLFDESGRALNPQSGKWQTGGQEIFVRIGLPPDANLPSGTEIKLWWE